MASILRNYYFTSTFLLSIILMASTYQATSRTMHEEIMHTRYEQWMSHHKRVYVTSEEKQKRFKIFKTNVEFIENFNKDPNRTYTLGTNKFTDLTTEEFLATHTGYKRPSSENSSTTNTPKSFRYQNMGYLPNSIDWRQLGAVTNVKNQQQCGCCWAFSAVAALEGLIQIQTGYLFSLSEQEILDCMTEDGCYGNLPDNAFEFIKRNGGLTTESAYPYMGYQERSCGYVNNNRRYGSIEGYEDVPQNDEFALQRAAAHQPVTIGIDPMILHHYRYGIIGGYCGQNLSHAVTIVGYGTSEDGIRYWLCKNSWGTNWGEDGYFRIQRDSGVEGGMCGIALAPSYPVA